MNNEILRQGVHFSGIIFILLILWKREIIFFLFFLSFFLLGYSWYIQTHQSFLERIERRFREILLRLERENVKKPFVGAFWFYFSMGLVFLIFPVNTAMLSSLVLIISDCLSTLIGIKFGRHKVIGRKTLEGSGVFFISAFFISLFFVPFWLGILCAMIGTLAEIFPEFFKFQIIDDNFFVPISIGIVLTLV